MKSLAELKRDKIMLRTSDPDRAGVCEMIVDTATKLAKAERREVTDKDLVSAVKKEIKQFTDAIDLIKKNNGDSSSHEKNIALLKEYLPPQMSEEELRHHIDEAIASLPEDQRIKKAMGKVIGYLKQFDNIDMGAATKIIGGLLK